KCHQRTHKWGRRRRSRPPRPGQHNRRRAAIRGISMRFSGISLRLPFNNWLVNNRLGARRALLRRAAVASMVAAAAFTPHALAAPLDQGVERYRGYLIEDIDRAVIGVRALRDHLKARDLDGAKRAWIEARVGWEHSEVFTSGFVPELDRQIDAWPDA